ncbi:MAG: hypothetical protein ACRDN0_29990 [Trebonia sp.]
MVAGHDKGVRRERLAGLDTAAAPERQDLLAVHIEGGTRAAGIRGEHARECLQGSFISGVRVTAHGRS